jgi:hypothetical protein
MRTLLAAGLAAFVLEASAQSTPAANYTDMWWNPAESGWGISFTQHSITNQVFAVWYTYDPREPGPTGGFKPLWIVMPGGSWTSPTTITGTVYVANGVPFFGSGTNQTNTAVGTFTFNFSSTTTATFAYNIAAPAGLPATNPAYQLPAMTGTKSIVRQGF